MKLAKPDQLQTKETPFEIKAFSALGISIIADTLDYVGAPIFAMPIVGDVADAIISGLLYRITKSKANLVINSIEFIPFIGDLIPTYTISTLIWIIKESRKKRFEKEIESRTRA